MHDPQAATAHNHLHWQSGGGGQPQWTVRPGDWKLVANDLDNGAGMNRQSVVPLWLSRLDTDPDEQTLPRSTPSQPDDFVADANR